ncbi:MAG: DUF4338 domain-containing protein [Sterolibacteriaceae bacterium]|nr:DUF4338 domain-containing protein [Sterolibacteriaceae bacterium]
MFPWVRIEHLASHVLGQLARQLADDWQACWGYRPLLLESFVDPAHYRGTCYPAPAGSCWAHQRSRFGAPRQALSQLCQADLRQSAAGAVPSPAVLRSTPGKARTMGKVSRRPAREAAKQALQKNTSTVSCASNNKPPDSLFLRRRAQPAA